NLHNFVIIFWLNIHYIYNVINIVPLSRAVETKRALPRHEFNKPGGGGTLSLGIGGVKSNKIFLGGLKDCHDEKAIRDYFSQFGGVTNVKLLLDKDTGRKRGFGFLEFEEQLSAERALAQGKHSINLTTVEVKKSTQKPDPGKRLRFPVSGSIRAGYIPPQPPTMESYNSSYNPYLAQTILPPSAFINGWASY
uniref:Heterogeneous nuclear ribonucleoprotein 87F-like n=1 Tax=Drosophila rhopaloa TaxID=1041015 RepID=A0A6P4FP38_DRORH